MAVGIDDTLSTKVFELNNLGVYNMPPTVIRAESSNDELKPTMTVIVVLAPLVAEAMLGETLAIEGPDGTKVTASVIDITGVPPNDRAPLAACAFNPVS